MSKGLAPIAQPLHQESALSLQSCGYPRLRSSDSTLVQPRGQLGSSIESEHDLVRFLVAPMSEAPLPHDKETALRQHTNRRGVVARGVSVKRNERV
jgi:hypothetical protein